MKIIHAVLFKIVVTPGNDDDDDDDGGTKGQKDTIKDAKCTGCNANAKQGQPTHM